MFPAPPAGVRRAERPGFIASRADGPYPSDAHSRKTILLTGATGYVGGHLLPALLDAGHDVRCLVRDPRPRRTLPAGAEVVEGDVLSGDGLDEALGGRRRRLLPRALDGRRRRDDDFAARDRAARAHFGEAVAPRRRRAHRLPRRPGGRRRRAVRAPAQPRTRSPSVLASHVRRVRPRPRGDGRRRGSASFLMLRSLVEHLPAMITPKWLDTRTQPVAIHDVVGTLAALADRDDAPGRGPARRRRRPHLPRDDAPLRRGRRPPPAGDDQGPGVHAAAVVLLGRAGHAGRARARQAARRGPERRDGRARAAARRASTTTRWASTTPFARRSRVASGQMVAARGRPRRRRRASRALFAVVRRCSAAPAHDRRRHRPRRRPTTPGSTPTRRRALGPGRRHRAARRARRRAVDADVRSSAWPAPTGASCRARRSA